MSQKDQYSNDDVSNLVQKLQATFLSDDRADQGQKPDEDDRAFRNKLAALLERLSRPVQKKKKDLPPAEEPDRSVEPSLDPSEADKADTVAESSSSAEIPEVQATEAATVDETEEQSAPLPSPAPKKKKPRTSKPRAEKSAPKKPDKTKSESAPTVEATELPVEETTVVERTALEETPIESAPVEEVSVDAESVAEEPIAVELAEEHAEEPPRGHHPLDLVLPIEESEPRPVESAPIEVVVSEPIEEAHITEATVADEPTPEAILPEPIDSVDRAPAPATAPSKRTVLEPKTAPVPPKKKSVEPTTASSSANPPAAERTAPAQDKRPAANQPITIKSPITVREARPTAHADPDAIVIRPPAPEYAQNETIVIRPKQAQKPQPVPHPIGEQASGQPIKIGKEAPPASSAHTVRSDSDGQSPKNMKKDTPKTASTPPAESPKKPPSIAAIRRVPDGVGSASDAPVASDEKCIASETVAVSDIKKSEPSSPDTKKPESPKTRVGGISLPRERLTAKKKPTPEKAPAHRETDGHLEEVLDEALITEPFAEEIPVDEPEELAPPPQRLSIFQRKQKRREEREEEKLSALDLICKRSGLTPDDIAMIFELGYESELGRLVGYEALKRLKTEHLRQVEHHTSHRYRTAFGYRGEEWTGNRRDAVLAAYVHDRRRVLVRLILTVLLSAILFFVEAPDLIGAPLLSLAAAFPMLLPTVGTLLFVCIALLSLTQLEAGARALFRFTPTPYSVCAILPPFVLIYDLLALFVNSSLPQVNFTASVTFLVIALCDLLRLCSEMRTLDIVSSDEPKQMLSAAPPRKKKLRSGDKIVKIINDDLGENLYQVKPGLRTVGFFRRSNDLTTASRTFSVQIIVMLSLATLLALVSAVQSSSGSTALTTFLSIFLAATPASTVFTYFYPLYRANRLLAKRGCTLVGEESVEELSCQKTVIFPDTKLYTAQKSTQLSIRTGDDFRTDLRLVSALLRRLGGTAEQITNGTRPTREDPPVSIVRIQDGGIEAMVDHSNHLLLGNVEFMKRGGIRIPRESSDVALGRPEGVSMMYVAINGVLKFSYEVEYAPNATTEDMIRDLAESDTAIAIHTYDPNLNDAFLQSARGEDAEPVRVIKPGRFEEDRPQELVDAVAVANGDALDMVAPIHAAKAISTVRKFGFRMQLIGSLIGSAAIVTLAVFGHLGTLGMLPIAAYQGFWILISLLSSVGEINPKKLHLR